MIREIRRGLRVKMSVSWELDFDQDRLLATSYAGKPAQLSPRIVSVSIDEAEGSHRGKRRTVGVSGNLLNKDGTVGGRTADLAYSSLNEMPTWIVDLVRADFTAELSYTATPSR